MDSSAAALWTEQSATGRTGFRRSPGGAAAGVRPGDLDRCSRLPGRYPRSACVRRSDPIAVRAWTDEQVEPATDDEEQSRPIPRDAETGAGSGEPVPRRAGCPRAGRSWQETQAC